MQADRWAQQADGSTVAPVREDEMPLSGLLSPHLAATGREAGGWVGQPGRQVGKQASQLDGQCEWVHALSHGILIWKAVQRKGWHNGQNGPCNGPDKAHASGGQMGAPVQCGRGGASVSYLTRMVPEHFFTISLTASNTPSLRWNRNWAAAATNSGCDSPTAGGGGKAATSRPCPPTPPNALGMVQCEVRLRDFPRYLPSGSEVAWGKQQRQEG